MTIELHSVELSEDTASKAVTIRVTGKLTKDDYERFIPEIDRLIEERGKIRILFDMHDFHGWDASALWEDFKFDLKHFRDIERLAMIGEKAWEHGMAAFCRPFTTAKIRYFDRSEVDDAKDWIEAD